MILSVKSGNTVAGMPAVSCMSLSNEPALVAVAVGKSLWTNAVMKKTRNFAINWIDFNERKIMELLSTPSKNVDKLKAAGIPYVRLLGTPVLKDSVAYAICEKTRLIETGDHTLFLGKVIGAMASLDFDEYWKFSEYRPVLYRGSSFRAPFIRLPKTN
jgi:flavin reductase (DIM6/NTAB) family NADH-FMN oxidoreductase RutF